MKEKRAMLLCAALGLTVLLIASVVRAADDGSHTQTLTQMARSIRTVAQKRSVAAQVAEQRSRAIEECLAILQTGSLEEKLSSAEMLGHLRAKESVVPLLERIDIHNTDVLEKSLETSYPVVLALAEIGYDSVKQIRKRIGQETDDLRLRLMLLVIKQALDAEDAITEITNVLEANKQDHSRLMAAAVSIGMPMRQRGATP